MIVSGGRKVIADRIHRCRRDKAKVFLFRHSHQLIQPGRQICQLLFLVIRLRLQGVHFLFQIIQRLIIRVCFIYILRSLNNAELLSGRCHIEEHHIGIPLLIGVLVIGIHITEHLLRLIEHDLAGYTIRAGAFGHKAFLTDRDIIRRTISEIVCMILNDGRVYKGKPSRTVLGGVEEIPATNCIQLARCQGIRVFPLILESLSYNGGIRSHAGIRKRRIHLTCTNQDLAHKGNQAVFVIILHIPGRFIAEEIVADFFSGIRTHRIIEHLVCTAYTQFICSIIYKPVQEQDNLVISLHQFYRLGEYLAFFRFKHDGQGRLPNGSECELDLLYKHTLQNSQRHIVGLEYGAAAFPDITDTII